MKFRIKVKQLDDAIKTIEGILRPEHISVVVKKDGLLVGGQSGGKVLLLKVPADVEKAGEFSVHILILKNVIKSRAEMEFSVEEDEATVNFKSKNYKGDFCTIPYEEVKLDSKQDAVKIEGEQQEAIARGLSSIAITNVHDQNPVMMGMKLSDKGLTLVGFDNHHVACYRTKKVKSKKPLSLTLSSETFSTIATLAKKNTYSLVMTENTLQAWNKEFNFVTPLVQADAGTGVTLDNALKLLAGLESETSATVKTEEFRKIIENSASVHESGISLHLQGESGKLSASMKSGIGKIKALLESKVKGKFDVQIDPALAQDIIALIKTADVGLHVFRGKVLWIKIEDKHGQNIYTSLLV
jgi:DNA polymerase III sliding clamp (beta) subunit (PCNA family)